MEPTPEQLAEIRDQVLAPFPSYDGGILGPKLLDSAARLAYQAGADEQLRLCVAWTHHQFGREAARLIDAAMRPKPPSLKQQALNQLSSLPAGEGRRRLETDLIRRAIESLPD